MQRSKFVRLLAMSLVLGACGCGQAPEGSSDETTVGGQNLTLGPGVTVTSGTYTITGPNGFTSAGNVTIGSSATIFVPVTGLPAGSGYTMYVWATASDGTMCNGTSTFSAPTPSTGVRVVLTCGIQPGSAEVTATLNVCPVLDSLEALPAEVLLGATISLTAGAHDSDDGPSPLTYAWTVNGAPLANHPEPALTFTCTSAGEIPIKVTALDGNPDPTCNDSLTATITCTAP